MLAEQPATYQPQNSPAEGSKIRRFLKKFGRKPSDEHSSTLQEFTTPSERQQYNDYGAEGTAVSQDVASGKKTTNKPRGNTLLGKTIFTGSQASSRGRQNSNLRTAASNVKGSSTGSPEPAATKGSGPAFANGTYSETPAGDVSPPQIEGLPSHAPSGVDAVMASQSSGLAGASTFSANSSQQSPRRAGMVAGTPEHYSSHLNGASAPLSLSSGSSALSHTGNSFDTDSVDGIIRRRDSTDNRTMDTGKSTKPTTLMSLETRDQPGGSSSMAPIAQHRHGENGVSSSAGQSPSSNRHASTAGNSVQFIGPSAGRTIQGTIVNLPGDGEPADPSPYTTVPSISRHHPSNNPTPTGIPPDNASMVTLASSTAPPSIGGAGSSRSPNYAPSLGGARSIVGSLMGDRRNSADTYASMKAIPPLSRRGSDESTRTGVDSVIVGGGHAGMASSGSTSHFGGPGAPGDRLSMHRTNSQRTVATQRSIPLSTSQSISANPGGSGFHGAERRTSSASANLLLAAQLNSGNAAAATAGSIGSREEGSNPDPVLQQQRMEEEGAIAVPSGGGLGSESSVGHGGPLEVPQITQTGPSPAPSAEGAEVAATYAAASAGPLAV